MANPAREIDRCHETRSLGLRLASTRSRTWLWLWATLAAGLAARSLELEEATSCDAFAFTRVDASSLACSYFMSLMYPLCNTCSNL